MTAQIKVKVQRKAIVKLKVLPRFPSDVIAGTGIIIDQEGANFTISADPRGGAFFTGPASPTVNAIPRFTVDPNLLDDTGVLIDDSNNITGAGNITAGGLVTGSNLDLPVELFGASPSASAATNNAAFALAFSTATAQGNRRVSAKGGTYNLSADLTLGGFEFVGAGETVTILNFSGAKGLIIPVGTSAKIRNMKIATTGMAISAGSAAGFTYQVEIENVWFSNNLIGIKANGLVFSRIKDCYFDTYSQEGIYVLSEFNPDGGDSLIEGCVFLTNAGVSGGTTNAAVRQESGGGWKMSEHKIVGGNRGWWHNANYPGASSSLVIEGGSIEGVAQAEIVISNQSSTVGNLYNVVIDGVQGGADTYGVYILPRPTSNTAWISDLVISAPAIRNSNGATAGLSIDGVDGLNISGGSINNAGTGATGIVIGAHCTGQAIIPAISGYTTRYTNASTGMKIIDFTASFSVLGSFNTILRATASTDITVPVTGTLATLAGAETLTNKTITGGSHTAATALGIRSTGTGAFDVRFTNTENLTANRSLILQLGDADRLLALTGNLAITAAFSLLGGFGTILRATGTTDITLPTTGTVATLAGSEAFTNKTYNGNQWTAGSGTLTLGSGKTATISNTLNFTGTDGSSVAFGAGGTIQPIAYDSNFAAPITNSLSGDVSLNNIANYFAGPAVAQGSTGTWFVSGTVTVLDTAGAATFFAKLWDGTTVIDSGAYTTGGTNFNGSFALSGFITAPAGNLRIDVRDISSTSGVIKANQTGNSKDSTITAYRIK